MYHYDTNTIHIVPIKSRYAKCITDAWQSIFNILKIQGSTQSTHLDKECSYHLKEAFKTENIKCQLSPPHLHKHNVADRAIRTYKNHLITGLCLCNTKFPLKEWDHLLPQCSLALNLLRSSRRYPSLSAYALLYGNFNFNITHMAPPGTKTLVHENQRNAKVGQFMELKLGTFDQAWNTTGATSVTYLPQEVRAMPTLLIFSPTSPVSKCNSG